MPRENPTTVLQQVLGLAKTAQSPLIQWNEAASKMHQQADQVRRDKIDAIVDLLEEHLELSTR